MLGRVVERFAVAYDDDAALVAQLLQHLLHHLQVLVVGHLVRHEHQQYVDVLALSLLRQVGQIEQALQVSDEGDDPFDRRCEL